TYGIVDIANKISYYVPTARPEPRSLITEVDYLTDSAPVIENARSTRLDAVLQDDVLRQARTLGSNTIIPPTTTQLLPPPMIANASSFQSLFRKDYPEFGATKEDVAKRYGLPTELTTDRMDYTIVRDLRKNSSYSVDFDFKDGALNEIRFT